MFRQLECSKPPGFLYVNVNRHVLPSGPIAERYRRLKVHVIVVVVVSEVLFYVARTIFATMLFRSVFLVCVHACLLVLARNSTGLYSASPLEYHPAVN